MVGGEKSRKSEAADFANCRSMPLVEQLHCSFQNFSVDVKNEWRYTSTPPTLYVLMASAETALPYSFQLINTELFKNSSKNFIDLNTITNDSKLVLLQNQNNC